MRYAIKSCDGTDRSGSAQWNDLKRCESWMVEATTDHTQHRMVNTSTNADTTDNGSKLQLYARCACCCAARASDIMCISLACAPGNKKGSITLIRTY